ACRLRIDPCKRAGAPGTEQVAFDILETAVGAGADHGNIPGPAAAEGRPPGCALAFPAEGCLTVAVGVVSHDLTSQDETNCTTAHNREDVGAGMNLSVWRRK